MTTFDEFIEREIVPALGEYVDDYDVHAIAAKVSMWDDKQGYVMNPDYTNDVFWLVVGMHDRRNNVTCPYCGAANNIGKAVVNSVTADEVEVEMCCYQCGTHFRRHYAFTE